MTDEKKDKNDLTRLENIAEFLHQEDAAVDDFFSQLNATTEEAPPVPEEPENFPPAFETPKEESVAIEEAPAENIFGDSDTTFESSSHDSHETAPFMLSEDAEVAEVSAAPEENNFSENDLMNEMVDKTMEHAVENIPEPEPEPEVEPEPEPEPEPVIEEVRDTPPLRIAPDVEEATFNSNPAPVTPQETFQDVKEFASNISYGDMAMGGNPPFSIILKEVKYREDVDDILLILKEHGFLKENNEETFRKSLERGTLLISHIGEYSAIYLCHKLRRFHVDILMGLADAIHPPKVPETSNRGLVNKKGLRLNHADHLIYDSLKVDVANILTTTTSLIESHEISRYVDTISEHIVLNDDIFEADLDFEEKLLAKENKRDSLLTSTLKKIRQVKDLTREPDMDFKTPKLTIKEVYDQLIMKLKIQAVKLKGNAIIGIQYQTTPLMGDHSNNKKYKLSCTGTVVWAKRL